MVKPVSVGLVCHVDVTSPSERQIIISRNAIELLVSHSSANLSDGCNSLISKTLSSILCRLISLTISSTYLNRAVARALIGGGGVYSYIQK